MDLLIRSNGSTHQRRQTSAGKPRVKSMSTSYFSSGKNAVRDLSASNLRDFSTVKIFFSARAWMNGSTTSDAAAVKSTVRQHKSKSPAAMILLSTKILRIVLRPSSISVVAVCAFLRNPAMSDGDPDTDAADSTPADCTATLFAGPLQQQAEHLEGLGVQPDANALPAKFSGGCVCLEGAEAIAPRWPWVRHPSQCT